MRCVYECPPLRAVNVDHERQCGNLGRRLRAFPRPPSRQANDDQHGDRTSDKQQTPHAAALQTNSLLDIGYSDFVDRLSRFTELGFPISNVQ